MRNTAVEFMSEVLRREYSILTFSECQITASTASKTVPIIQLPAVIAGLILLSLLLILTVWRIVGLCNDASNVRGVGVLRTVFKGFFLKERRFKGKFVLKDTTQYLCDLLHSERVQDGKCSNPEESGYGVALQELMPKVGHLTISDTSVPDTFDWFGSYAPAGAV